MLCERCNKNEATCYYHENVNGAEKTYHLCNECMKEMEKNGEIKSAQMSTAEMMFNELFGGSDPLFSSLFAPSKSKSANSRAQVKEAKKCSLCGATFDELIKEGKVGCAKCYDVFAQELENSIRSIHGRTEHIGREPKLFRAKNENKRKIDALEKELKEAINTENYERAAEIRDEIKSLKAQDDNSGANGAA